MPGAAPPPPALGEIVTEVLYYLSLSLPLAIGITVAMLAIPEAHGGVVSRRVRELALPTAVFVSAVAIVQFFTAAARSATVALSAAFDRDVVAGFLTSPPSRGSAVGGNVMALIQLVVFLVVAIGLAAMRRSPSRWLAACVTTVAAAVTLIPNIPSSLSPINNLARNMLTAMHVLGAACWVGGLLVLAAAGLMGRRAHPGDLDDAERAARDWIQIWERYSIVALCAVGALIVSGAWLSWSHVGAPAQLLTTSYGRYLAVKLLLVIALLAAGGLQHAGAHPENPCRTE